MSVNNNMSDQYTSNNDKGDFSGSLVDNTMTRKDMATEYPPDQPNPYDSTSEGGYGGDGDAFGRRHQSPADQGQFGSSPPAKQRPGAFPSGVVDDRDFEDHAGEGIVPPNQAAAAQATSSGTGAEAKYANRRYADDSGDNIGG